jgi:hypothetical protein
MQMPMATLFTPLIFFIKNKKAVILLPLLILLKTVDASPNLILNPSAESVTGGILDNWTDIADLGSCCGGGTWWMPNGNRYFTPTAVDGVNIFSAGVNNGPTTSELRQDVDVSGYASAIDAGTASFMFTGFMGGNGDGDLQDIRIEYLDAGKTTVLESDDTGFQNEPFAFVSVGPITRTAPAGTRFIRIRLMAQNHSASMDAYFDNLSLTTNAPLPVTLLDFFATVKSDHSVLLQWQTAQEENSNYFDVQRSATGSDYTFIGRMTAAGNSSLVKNYAFPDETPLAGTNYYRLKMVDLDGEYKYSNVVVVTGTTDESDLEILGNPFTDQVKIKINQSKESNVTLTLIDMSGRIYKRQSYDALAGENFLGLYPTSSIPAGSYLLNIQSAAINKTVKLVKRL